MLDILWEEIGGEKGSLQIVAIKMCWQQRYVPSPCDGYYDLFFSLSKYHRVMYKRITATALDSTQKTHKILQMNVCAHALHMERYTHIIRFRHFAKWRSSSNVFSIQF